MSGFSAPDPRFISPTSDIHRSGGEGVVSVHVQPNMNEKSIRTGGQRIFQVATEQAESSELLISSWFRRSGTPFAFTSNIGGPLFRPRNIQLRNAIIPQIPNINRNNNQFCFQFVSSIPFGGGGLSGRNTNPITITFEMETGYYTPDTFANELVKDITNALQTQITPSTIPRPIYEPGFYLDSILDVDVTAGYDYEKMRFLLNININSIQISSTFNGDIFNRSFEYMFSYWLTDNCSFIRRGKNMVDFPDSPFIIRQNETANGEIPVYILPPFPPRAGGLDHVGMSQGLFASLNSLPGPQFIYTRYVTIDSQALLLYAFGESRVDLSGVELTGQAAQTINVGGAGGGGGKIVGVVNTAQYYAPSKEFAGANRITTVDAPSIGIKNAQLKLNEFIDFRFIDEFGFTLDEVFPRDNNWGPTLAFIISY